MSGYKNIIVPYYGQAGELTAIEFASAVSREFGAEMSILYVSRILKEISEDERRSYWSKHETGGFNAGMAYLDEIYQTQLRKDAELAHDIAVGMIKNHALLERQRDAPILVDTRCYTWEQNLALETDLTQLLIDRAMVADLVVTSASVIGIGGQRDVMMGILQDSGRPLFVVPTKSVISDHLPRKIIVAWKQSIHAVRAISEAIPLLRAAHRVLVLEIAEDGKRKNGRISASDISRWLSRHGVATESLYRDNDSRKAENILDEEISLFEADALVMGAYSRSRMREMIFGSFTQHVLDNVRVPTLFVH